MLILLVLRRLSPRGKVITGTVLLALGAAVIGVSAALSINLYVHGVILLVLSAVMWSSLIAGRRRARRDAVADQGSVGTMEVMARSEEQ
jgi:membrane protein implicated in regulation of membrane protease activity